jgi:uncharacterized membrane protein YbaN (DUF454 family)
MAEGLRRLGRARRGLFIVLGFFFVGLALAGAVVPGLPVTINAIIASYFFARSSERFDRWLLEHRLLGPVVRDYRSKAGFTVRAKSIAVTAITLSIASSAWLLVARGGPGWVPAVLAAAWIYALWFVLKQPTKPSPAS